MMKVNLCLPGVSVVLVSEPLKVPVVLFINFTPSTQSCRLVMVPCGGLAVADTGTGFATDAS